MKRGLIFLIVFLFLVLTVSALEFKHEVIQGQALPGNGVSYNLIFNNNEQIALTITFRSVDLNWVLDDEGESFTVLPGESRNVDVSFTPLAESRIKPGNYGITLFADTQTTRLERILPARVLDYGEVLDVEFSPVARIDPRRGAILRLAVENTKNIEANNLDLQVKSEHFEFTRMLSLKNHESTILEFPVSINPETVTGEYFAHVSIMLGDKTMVDTQLSYNVEEYEELKEVATPYSGFFRGGERIVQVNEGNSYAQGRISRQFGAFAFKFTKFEQEPTRVTKNDDGYLAEWELNIGPKEQKSVEYTTSYRTLVLIIVVLIVLLAGIYVFRKRNAVVIAKRVLAMHSEGGGVRVVKIVLNIRNRGSLTVNNLRVIDTVPAAIKAPTKYSALRPGQVKASAHGTTMVWDFASVKPKEEKIISYVLEGKIHLIGKLMLPPAVARYILLGRPVSARSSSLPLREKK